MEQKIFCPIRKIHLAALPEERVRIHLLRNMVDILGYPPATLAIEKELALLPHLSLRGGRGILPQRRADIVCFAKGIAPHDENSLWPLLLIECKAVKLNAKMINQVIGYNHYLHAYFIALANQYEIRMGWLDAKSGEYSFIDRLPSYGELISSLSRAISSGEM